MCRVAACQAHPAVQTGSERAWAPPTLIVGTEQPYCPTAAPPPPPPSACQADQLFKMASVLGTPNSWHDGMKLAASMNFRCGA
jgi:hypothetical protein